MVSSARLLRWLYLGRVTLASGVFVGVLLVWPKTNPSTQLIATFAFIASFTFSIGSYWYTNVFGRPAGKNYLYSQVLFDTLLVTAIVHITNGPEGGFPPLYILVIAAGALLLPLPGGVLIGALASMLYFADLIFFHAPKVSDSALIPIFIWQVPTEVGNAILQIFLFTLVALVTGSLGDRLRRAGHELAGIESELRQLRLDTGDILEAIDTGLVTVDEQGRLVYMNDAAESVLGIHEANWRSHMVLDELDRRAPGLGTVIRRTASMRVPVRRFEIRMRTNEGERFLGVRTTLLDRTENLSVTAVFQDVTDSKQIEELSLRAERLQAVAELGASLAHEIKNPLASIRSAVEQLAGGPLSDHDKATLRRLVVAESNRLSRLLSDFMEFSRVELRRHTAVDLVRVTNDAIGLVAQHPDAQNSAKIDYTTPTMPMLVNGDPDLLHRAVFNLVLNAVQHAGENGAVRVQLARVDEENALDIDEPIRLTVADSGPGIPQEDIPRVFDPFFTTRPGGTGLGLAMVHRAVEAHRGRILVNAGADGGAEFTVYLPAQSERRNS